MDRKQRRCRHLRRLGLGPSAIGTQALIGGRAHALGERPLFGGQQWPRWRTRRDFDETKLRA